MAIEFSIDREDLIRALRPLFGASKHAKSTALDYVDIKAQENEVEFITTGFASGVKAEVESSGCARVPFPLLETLFRNPQKLAWTPAGRLSVCITEGHVQAGVIKFSHSDISLQAAMKRAADLPTNTTLADTLAVSDLASLVDTLALGFRFNTNELAESGLLERVRAAQQRADGLVDRACKILEPLNIDRDALGRFVFEGITRIRSHKKLSL